MKKKILWQSDGLLPNFFKLESQYNKLYCDRLDRGAHGQARTRPRHGQACLRYGQGRPAIRSRHGPRHGLPRARACGSARAGGLASRGSRYKNCIVAKRGGDLRSRYSALGATTARHGATTQRSVRCDTAEVRPRYSQGPGDDTTGLGVVHAQCAQSLGHGCAYCALDPVLTQNTVLSHCSQNFSKKK